jgi:hypothetical protein
MEGVPGEPSLPGEPEATREASGIHAVSPPPCSVRLAVIASRIAGANPFLESAAHSGSISKQGSRLRCFAAVRQSRLGKRSRVQRACSLMRTLLPCSKRQLPSSRMGCRIRIISRLQEKLRYDQEEADLQTDRLAAEQVIMRKTLALQTYSGPDSDTFLIMSCAYDLCSIPECRGGSANEIYECFKARTTAARDDRHERICTRLGSSRYSLTRRPTMFR